MSIHNQHIPIITIDGPVGSGKGSLAVMLASQLGFNLLDSGALYRVLALAIIKHDIDIANQAAIENIAINLDIRFDRNKIGQPAAVILEGVDVSNEIRTEACGSLASKISGYVAVRSALMGRQRAFLTSPGLVADGRDMGTIVFPDADIKIYLTASQEVRAQRRFKQLQPQNPNLNFTDLLAEIKSRDQRDINRPIAPLKPADDAIVIDSSDMSIDLVFSKMLAIAKKKLSG
jgi:cytidylate kinase